jgi:hypothetical protein
VTYSMKPTHMLCMYQACFVHCFSPRMESGYNGLYHTLVYGMDRPQFDSREQQAIFMSSLLHPERLWNPPNLRTDDSWRLFHRNNAVGA